MNKVMAQSKTAAALFFDERVREWEEHHSSPEDYWYRRNNLGSEFLSKYLRAHSKCLEIGCAAGQFSELLYRRGHIVFGIDISKGMVEAAWKRLGPLGVPEKNLKCCQPGSLPFDDNSFDLVTALDVLPYVENQPAYLKEVHRVLTHDGLAFFNNVNRGSLFVNITLVTSFHRAFGGKWFIPGPWWWRGVYNYVRTGYASGGFVDLAKAIQARSANMLDRFLLNAGFSIVDGYDMYNLRPLDRNPLERKGFSARAARRWAWNHFGLYQKKTH